VHTKVSVGIDRENDQGSVGDADSTRMIIKKQIQWTVESSTGGGSSARELTNEIGGESQLSAPRLGGESESTST
jgi:hypothetical protein